MVEKERMQPFWYQGTLIDPNEELPFPLEQLEAENAWNIPESGSFCRPRPVRCAWREPGFPSTIIPMKI